VLIHCLPIFHVHGLFVALHGALLNGSKMIWMARFEPKQVLSYLPQATIFMGVPTLYVRLLGEPGLDAKACASMRLFVAGSAPLLLETFQAWTERTGHTILERYGMSETVMLTSNPYTADKRFAGQSERRGGTVGFPLPGVHVRVGSGEGQACAVGEVGEICVASPGVTPGSPYTEPDRNKGLFAEGRFLRTGDLGRLDSEGYLFITGRAKDLIIRGGHNIDPSLIEEALMGHDAVAFVGAIGQPDIHSGELPCAYVELIKGRSVDVSALLDYARDHITERAAIPKYIEILPELPKTAVGKVLKPELRKRAIARVLTATLAEAGLAAEVREVVEDKTRGLVAMVAAKGVVDQAAVATLLGSFATAWDWAT
jgi:fatty-acyl-CoA synthase